MADVTHLHKLVRKANGVQDFQRAGLNASGTAVVGRPVVLIDDPAGNAMPIQLNRHEQARRTCAHHQYLGVSGHQIFDRQQSWGRIRGTDLTEYLPASYSPLRLAARTTLPHFPISPATNVLNLSGVFATAVAPKSANRALMSELANPAFVSLLSLSTISTGVFLGTPIPFQPLAS